MLFIDTSSESDFEGFAPAEVEASMMPTVRARVDSSEDEMGENNEGEGEPATDESDSDIDQAPADGLDADDIRGLTMMLTEKLVVSPMPLSCAWHVHALAGGTTSTLIITTLPRRFLEICF